MFLHSFKPLIRVKALRKPLPPVLLLSAKFLSLGNRETSFPLLSLNRNMPQKGGEQIGCEAFFLAIRLVIRKLFVFLQNN